MSAVRCWLFQFQPSTGSGGTRWCPSSLAFSWFVNTISRLGWWMELISIVIPSPVHTKHPLLTKLWFCLGIFHIPFGSSCCTSHEIAPRPVGATLSEWYLNIYIYILYIYILYIYIYIYQPSKYGWFKIKKIDFQVTHTHSHGEFQKMKIVYRKQQKMDSNNKWWFNT